MEYVTLSDFSIFMEFGYESIPDIATDPRFFPPRLTPWQDQGLVFAECGCIDHWKTFKPVFLYHVDVAGTYYHEPWCLWAGFPMEHQEVSMYADHLRPSGMLNVRDHNRLMTARGYVKLAEHNWFDHDTIGRFAECIRAKVSSMNTVPKARNWA